MAFLMKRKKFKFLVTLTLEELSAVPFVNGILFCKIRLLHGGSFSDLSTREEVQQNCVRWGKRSSFMCKMSASPATGVLDPCICRVSVRKELKGGKAFIKLGFVDLNLAEFAGSGMTARCYILEGYEPKKTRQDNSILKISISLQLLLGDPCFKTPAPHTTFSTIVAGEDALELDCKGDAGNDGERDRPSRPSSLRLSKCRSWITASGISEDLDSIVSTPDSSTSSCYPLSSPSSVSSQHSKVSGYSSEHSRSVSLSEPTRRRKLSSVSSGFSSGPSSAADIQGEAGRLAFEKPPFPILPCDRHTPSFINRDTESKSKGLMLSVSQPLVRPQLEYCVQVWAPHYRKDGERVRERAGTIYRNRSRDGERRRNRVPENYPSWVSDTRVNADDIVECIIQTQDFTNCSDSEESGLQLVVDRDGSTFIRGVSAH